MIPTCPPTAHLLYTRPAAGAGKTAKPSVFRPFRLDLRESGRYIRDTFRQAVSFACSERPPD